MHKHNMFKNIISAAVLGVFGLAIAPAHAADAAKWPDKPIRVIVPFPPGGGADIVARIVSAKMSDELGQQLVVENRAGATGQIGANAVAKSAPDGYTILLDATAFSINPVLYKSLPYDSKTDFVPISLIVKFPLLLVKNPKFKPATVQDLIKQAKDEPGRITYGSSGIGSVQHLTSILFARRFDLNMLHVPYKGGSQSIADLVGGQIQFIFANGASSLPFVQSKQVTALATTGAARSTALPNVPTMAEAGVPNFQAYEWTALFAPKGTPAAIVAKLSAAAQDAVKNPDVQKQLIGMGGEPAGDNPEKTKAFIYGQMDHWAKIVKDNNVKIQ